MADVRQRTIIKVFRKFSNSLGPDALQFIEEILDQHEIEDADVESSLETLAKEYNKQDDAIMKVSVDVLKRVYESLQDQGERTQVEKELIDPENHLFFIDAFEMPRWTWSQERGTFEKSPAPLTSSGSPESRVISIRDRLNIIKQCVLRNEHFAPSTLPSRDREKLVTLKSTKQLLGRFGERFLLLGMLAYNKEGKLCLEDADGSVELDFSSLDDPGDGLFSEGCFALVEGEYTEEATLEIIAIGQPPCESRETARSIYGHIDFLGKGATSLLEDAVRIREEIPELHFFFLSDVWLDHPQTLPGIQKMFDNCIENDFIPRIIVMCGNFTSKSIAHGNGRDVQIYQGRNICDALPLLSTLTGRLKTKVPKVHFASNPCRIKFFDQEIVIFREDLMARMLRNVVGVKPDVKSEDLKRFLVQSILDQSHLSPLTIDIQPVLSDYDHSLRLYPLPTALILADKYDSYKVTYTGCHVFNPGSFVGKALAFSTYTPAEVNSEEW
ncbi:DNA polymerase epsilon, subunit B [Flammula alnicola]|nr:DNA polymerase epsilon, subunit B [Flammula alnicola]